jgi:hypothetical protein
MCGDKPKWGKGIQDNQLAILRNKANDINAKSFFIFYNKMQNDEIPNFIKEIRNQIELNSF